MDARDTTHARFLKSLECGHIMGDLWELSNCIQNQYIFHNMFSAFGKMLIFLLFGEIFANFEIGPRFNESCSSPDHAQLCENDCAEITRTCIDDCHDQA